ncbi:MAG: FtsX-like permease family protein [Clostridiales bacterium]|nr:FtsX-like permease family protein [Clostridiales bacterium]
MRSFLTMLGMIIGVGSVITLIGLMNGATNYILDSFDDLGTNLINVNITNTDTRKVDVDEMYEFVEENRHLFQGVTPKISSRYTIKNGSTSMTTAVNGVGEDYLEINNLELSSGRFIQYADIKNRYNACVIGTYIVQELFDGKVSLGDTLKINGQLFEIVGIQEEKADSKENSADDCIYIPYSNAARLAGSTNISTYVIAANNADVVEQGEDILDHYLYGILKNEDLYYIMSMTELLDMINEMNTMMSSILGGIAGISLLVAGIGIMNIMLVSVVERTKEIGIRKAIGAKKKDIMRQFVIEATLISCLGGILGIIFGYFLTKLLGGALGLDAAPTMNSILMAFGISAAIGIGFGYMPANKAAKLNPIDALRSE